MNRAEEGRPRGDHSARRSTRPFADLPTGKQRFDRPAASSARLARTCRTKLWTRLAHVTPFVVSEIGCKTKVRHCARLPAMATVVTTDVKLLRCNGQPWGFRLSGGVDFTFPLTAVRVTIDGLAHTAGLQAGDVIVRLNGEPISQLTHAQAYNKLVSAGDDIVLSVVRSHEIAQRHQGQ